MTVLLYFVAMYLFFGTGLVGATLVLVLGVFGYAVLMALVRKPKTFSEGVLKED